MDTSLVFCEFSLLSLPPWVFHLPPLRLGNLLASPGRMACGVLTIVYCVKLVSRVAFELKSCRHLLERKA